MKDEGQTIEIKKCNFGSAIDKLVELCTGIGNEYVVSNCFSTCLLLHTEICAKHQR
jgi:hypothetical protein